MKHSRRGFVSTGTRRRRRTLRRRLRASAGAGPRALPAEDGYELWLRYASPGAIVSRYRAALGQVLVEGSSPTSEAIRAELKRRSVPCSATRRRRRRR